MEPRSSFCNFSRERPAGCRNRVYSILRSSALVTNLAIGYFIWHDIILFGKIFINGLFFINFYMTRNNLTGQKQPKALFLRAARGRGRITVDRITQRPEMMGGKACIRGLRVTVGAIVGQIGAGRSVDELLVEYPYLEREDILQALRYAAWRAEEREVVLADT
jgi:uncharacterized protein (DUF433 family)